MRAGWASLDGDMDAPRPKFFVNCRDEEAREGTGWEDDRPAESPPASIPVPETFASTPEVGNGLQPDLLRGPEDWREEVSARLHRYRARRRPRAPRYPSLRLKFDAPENNWAPSTRATEAPALATRQAVAEVPAMTVATPDAVVHPVAVPEPAHEHVSLTPECSAKIIEFPKWSYTPAVRYSDLAEPVIDRPRILEAPEIVPPPPALGGITIEEEQKQEPARRPGIDMPLQCARLNHRLLAMAIDVMIVFVAGGIFGAICYRIAGERPETSQVIFLAGGVLTSFWIAYQYLLIVYCGTTPGLRAMKLQLQRFDGSLTTRSLRRWRVLGSVLSAISLGMGYAWQFLDEDALCWHERITKTYLAPEKQS
jgi:uncharacterized RDD family membrane protein YckC